VALAQSEDSQTKNQIIGCVNNLKQIGLAYRLWEGDNGDKFPQHVSTRIGGAMEQAARGNVAPVFQVMSNELSTPKILVCPADTSRFAAENFTTDFGNSHISYFVGLDASDDQPATLLSGDDNFVIGSVSIKPGLLNVSTNASISWTDARHEFTTNVFAGNIGFADGAVQQVLTEGLQTAFHYSGVATNRLAIP